MSGRRAPQTLAAVAALALGVWAFFPVVLLAIHASDSHAVWTGADGLIGADGVLGADQLQYLAWARSIAGHGLAADLFTLGPAGHVFLEPVSGAIGGLLALGVPLVAGYLLAKALAVVVLAAGVVAWVRRLLGAAAVRAQVAALVLALFTVTPATALINWAQTGSAPFRFAAYLAGDELLSAGKLWGYVPAALAIALLALALLALERGLAAPAERPGRGWVALAAGLGLGCAWLHPWQGITLAIILAGLLALRRRRAELAATGCVMVATVLPLAYYLALSETDSAWRLAAHNEIAPRLPASVLLLCIGPLVAIAALGIRRSGLRTGAAIAEQALVLWIPAALITYFVNDAFATHALQGLGLPFAVLAVRGAQRIRLPALIGGLCVALLTVPGLAYAARKFVRTADSPLVQYALPADDAAALRWVHDRAPAGGVLAPTPFAAVVPARTGRAVWVGHGDWSPHYRLRARQVDRLFDGRLRPARAARALVAQTGARILVADCAHRTASTRLAGALAGRVQTIARFGCATVLVLTPPGARPRR